MSKFVYRQIEQELKRRIENGYYAPNERIGGSRELAEEFESSPGTVDKALQQLVDSGYLQRTQRRGTFVNPSKLWASASNSRSRSHLIGAIVFDSSYPYIWAPAIRGIEHELERNSYHLVIGNDEGDPDKAKRYVDDLLSKGIDGFIFVPIGMSTKEEYEQSNGEIIEYFRRHSIPFVLFHRCLENSNSSSVVTDNYVDTRRLTREMMRAGISKPVCLSHNYTSVARERERAFVDELTAIGLQDAEDRVFRLHPTKLEVDASNIEEIQRAFLSGMDIDGALTVGAHVLHAARLAVQDSAELSMKGLRFATFDYTEETYRSPDVAMSMIQPNFEMGRLAADLLLKELTDYQGLDVQITVRSRLLHYSRDSA